MWRIRISNWLCSRGLVKSSACTARERTGCLGGAKRANRSRIVNRHDLDEFASDALRILLLNELGEDAFEIRELKRSLEFGWRSVGQDPASRSDDDTVADELDHLQNMRDVEYCLALRGERFEKILEETCGDHVEAGERFVKDQQFRIM